MSDEHVADYLLCQVTAATEFKKLRGKYAESAYQGPLSRCRKANIMGGMRSYRELDAWQLSMTLVETTYALTRRLPDSERFNLTSQMQKSATSIPSNVAEGQARGTAGFGLWFLRVAIGSAAELSTQAELTRRLKYVTPDDLREFDSQLERVQQMLYGMRNEHLRRLAKPAAAAGSALLLFFVAKLF